MRISTAQIIAATASPFTNAAYGTDGCTAMLSATALSVSALSGWVVNRLFRGKDKPPVHSEPTTTRISHAETMVDFDAPNLLRLKRAAEGFLEDHEAASLFEDVSRHCGGPHDVMFIRGQLPPAIKALQERGMPTREAMKLMSGIMAASGDGAHLVFRKLSTLLDMRSPEGVIALLERLRPLPLNTASRGAVLERLPALAGSLADDEMIGLLRDVELRTEHLAEFAIKQLPALLDVVPHERIPGLFERAMWADHYVKPLVLEGVMRIATATRGIKEPEEAMDDLMMVVARTMCCGDFWRRGRALLRYVELVEKNPRLSTTKWWSSTLGRDDVDAALAIEMLYNTIRNSEK